MSQSPRDGPSPRDRYLARKHLLKVAEQLPEPERNCIELLYEHGASIHEVALKLDMDPHTVESHCRSAKAQLKSLLEDKDK